MRWAQQLREQKKLVRTNCSAAQFIRGQNRNFVINQMNLVFSNALNLENEESSDLHVNYRSKNFSIIKTFQS